MPSAVALLGPTAGLPFGIPNEERVVGPKTGIDEDEVEEAPLPNKVEDESNAGAADLFANVND